MNTQRFTRLPLCLLTLGGLMAPTYLQADCVPTAPNNYTVPYTMVTLKNYASGNAVASYTTGALVASNTSSIITSGITWSGTQQAQLFSDRTANVDCGPLFCSQQPFNINEADHLGLSIWDGYVLFNGHSTTVTLTLESWGNGKESFAGTCDATTGELYGSVGGNTFVTIAFGTPQPPPPPPQ